MTSKKKLQSQFSNLQVDIIFTGVLWKLFVDNKKEK